MNPKEGKKPARRHQTADIINWAALRVRMVVLKSIDGHGTPLENEAVRSAITRNQAFLDHLFARKEN